MSIGEYAFYGCSSMTNVTIPDSMTSIGYWAFSGCYNVRSVTITGEDRTKAENVKQMMIDTGIDSDI